MDQQKKRKDCRRPMAALLCSYGSYCTSPYKEKDPKSLVSLRRPRAKERASTHHKGKTRKDTDKTPTDPGYRIGGAVQRIGRITSRRKSEVGGKK